MKALNSMLAILIVSTSYLFAEDISVTTKETYYGIAVSWINTGTGHGMGYTVNASITKGRKSLEAGLIYSDRESKIAGGDFKYRIYLGNIKSLQDDKKFYIAYLQYNLVYQKGISYSADLVFLGDVHYVVESDPGTIATMGHYIAYGNKIKLFHNVYIDTSIGLGYYRGSLDKVEGPDTWGIHNENSGFTYSLKIGFGYAFK